MENDFDPMGRLLRRSLWQQMLQRTPTIVRSPRTSSPTEGGQPVRNMSSEDPLQRNLTKDFSSPQEESEEEDDDDDFDDDKNKNKNSNKNSNNNNNNNMNMNRNNDIINENANNNNNNNNGVRAPPPRPSIETILNRPVVASETGNRELALADRERLKRLGLAKRELMLQQSEGTRTEVITIPSDGDDETDDDYDDDYDDGYATADDYGDDDDVFDANVDANVVERLPVTDACYVLDSFDDEEDGFDDEEDVQRYHDEEDAAYERGVGAGFEEADHDVSEVVTLLSSDEDDEQNGDDGDDEVTILSSDKDDEQNGDDGDEEDDNDAKLARLRAELKKLEERERERESARERENIRRQEANNVRREQEQERAQENIRRQMANNVRREQERVVPERRQEPRRALTGQALARYVRQHGVEEIYAQEDLNRLNLLLEEGGCDEEWRNDANRVLSSRLSYDEEGQCLAYTDLLGARYTGSEALARREADNNRLIALRSIVREGLREGLRRRDAQQNPGVGVDVLITRHERQRVNAQRQDEIVNDARRNRNKQKKRSLRELIERRKKQMSKSTMKKIPWTQMEDDRMVKYWDKNANDWKGMAFDLENEKLRQKKRNGNVGWFTKDNGQVQDRITHLKDSVRQHLGCDVPQPGELRRRLDEAQEKGLDLYSLTRKAKVEAFIPPPISETESDESDSDDDDDGDDFGCGGPPAKRRRDDDDDDDNGGGRDDTRPRGSLSLIERLRHASGAGGGNVGGNAGDDRGNSRPKGSLNVSSRAKSRFSPSSTVGVGVLYATMDGLTSLASASHSSDDSRYYSRAAETKVDFFSFLVGALCAFVVGACVLFGQRRPRKHLKKNKVIMDGGFLIGLLVDLRHAVKSDCFARARLADVREAVDTYLSECSNPIISQYDVSVFQEGLRKRYCYDIYTSNPGPRERRYAIRIRPDDETNPYRRVQRANARIRNLHLSTRAPDTIQATKYRVDDFLKYVDEQNDEIELINLGLQAEGDDRFFHYLDPSQFSQEQMEEYLFQYCSRGTVKYDTLHHYSLRLKSFFHDAFPNLRPNPCGDLKAFFAGLKRQQILRAEANRLIKSRAITPDVVYDCWCYIELAFHSYEESDNAQKLLLCRNVQQVRTLRNYILVALGLLTGIRPFALWTIYAQDVRLYRDTNYFSVAASEDKRFDSVSEVYKNDYHFFPGPAADSINRRFAVMMKTWLNLRDLSNELALQNQMRGAVPSQYLFFPLLLDDELGTQKKHRAAAIGRMLRATLEDAVNEERLQFRLHDGSIDPTSRITAYSMRYTVASGLHGCGMYQTDIEKWLHWSSKAKTSDTYIDRSFNSPYFSQFSKYLYGDIRDQYQGHNIPRVERDLADLREDRRRRVQMNVWNR